MPGLTSSMRAGFHCGVWSLSMARGPHAFDRLAGGAGPQVEAVMHHVALHAQVVGQAHAAARRICSSVTRQHQRRALAQVAAVLAAHGSGEASSASTMRRTRSSEK